MRKIIKGFTLMLISLLAFAFTRKSYNYCLYKADHVWGTCPLTERPYSYTLISHFGGDKFIDWEHWDGSCDAEVPYGYCTQEVAYFLN